MLSRCGSQPQYWRRSVRWLPLLISLQGQWATCGDARPIDRDVAEESFDDAACVAIGCSGGSDAEEVSCSAGPDIPRVQQAQLVQVSMHGRHRGQSHHRGEGHLKKGGTAQGKAFWARKHNRQHSSSGGKDKHQGHHIVTNKKEDEEIEKEKKKTNKKKDKDAEGKKKKKKKKQDKDKDTDKKKKKKEDKEDGTKKKKKKLDGKDTDKKKAKAGGKVKVKHPKGANKNATKGQKGVSWLEANSTVEEEEEEDEEEEEEESTDEGSDWMTKLHKQMEEEKKARAEKEQEKEAASKTSATQDKVTTAGSKEASLAEKEASSAKEEASTEDGSAEAESESSDDEEESEDDSDEEEEEDDEEEDVEEVEGGNKASATPSAGTAEASKSGSTGNGGKKASFLERMRSHLAEDSFAQKKKGKATKTASGQSKAQATPAK